MKTTQGSKLHSLRSVQTFLNDNAVELGDVIDTGLRTMLDDAIAELDAHVEVQNGETRAAQSAIARREKIRAAIVSEHMAKITTVAKLQLAGKPALISFTLPRDNPTVERLAALAKGMARAAEPYADVFIKAGAKPDFLQALRTAADDMVQARQDSSLSKSRVHTSTSALRSKLSRGRKLVKALDTYVKAALVGNSDLLSSWKRAKRVPLIGAAPAATAEPPATAAA